LTLELRQGNETKRHFPVAVGKADTPTPLGYFTVINIIKDPTWYPAGRTPVPPGKDNPLGDYWLGLSLPGYGIHGNNQPASIGYPQSSGCIRMHNHDLLEIIRFVKVGTPVEIVYETVDIKQDSGRAWLTVYPDLYQRESNLQSVIRQKVEGAAVLYPVHWEALWAMSAGERPRVIEIPRQISLLLDGEVFPAAAFLQGEQLYLPSALTRLWERDYPERYLELTEFMRLLAGKVYGFFNPDENKISLHTLRIYCNGDLFPVRGWFQDEPLLPEKLVVFLGKSLTPVVAFSPDERIVDEGGACWVPLATAKKCWPQLGVEWDDRNWVLNLTY